MFICNDKAWSGLILICQVGRCHCLAFMCSASHADCLKLGSCFKYRVCLLIKSCCCVVCSRAHALQFVLGFMECLLSCVWVVQRIYTCEPAHTFEIKKLSPAICCRSIQYESQDQQIRRHTAVPEWSALKLPIVHKVLPGLLVCQCGRQIAAFGAV